MKRLFLALLALAALLAACGRPASSTPAPAFATGAPAKAQAGSAIAAARPPAPGAPASETGSSAVPAEPLGSGLPALPPAGRMIIKNGSLSLAVTSPEDSLGQVDQLVATEQGVIASQTVRSQNGETFANLSIQVPPDRFEDTLAKLRDLRAPNTSVLIDTVSSQDVTAQYSDLQAQYTNLQAERDAYQKLLDQAKSVADIITLTNQITTIQTQMDQIRGRQNLIARQAGVSVIELSLSPVGALPLPNPRPLPQPLQAAGQAWIALRTGLQALAVGLVWAAILVPLPGLLLVGSWFAYRRLTAGPAHQPEGSRT